LVEIGEKSRKTKPKSVQLLGQLADGADPAAERFPQRVGRVPQRGLGPPQQPRDDPHAVAEQLVESLELGLEAESKLGGQREQMDPIVAIA
jgi:hypothetical protein